MLDIQSLLSLLQGNPNSGQADPMVSGGGFGGGQAGFSPTSLIPIAGDFASNAITKNSTDKYGRISDGNAKLASGVSGAAKGAAIGSIIPGLGTLAGAGIGGGLGLLFGKGNEIDINKIQNDQAKQDISLANTQSHNRGTTIARNSNPYGQESPGYYKFGGSVVPNYKVEDGEVINAPDNNPPITDNNGIAERIGKNTFKFKGDKHSDPSGGIGVKGGDTPFADASGNVEPSGFVFSNELKADPSNFLSGL